MAPKRKAKASSQQPPLDDFTPERFESELRSLAAKAQDQTWTKSAMQQAPLYLTSALLLALMAVYSNVSQLALSPVYGSIPSSRWHARAVAMACFMGWAGNVWLANRLPVKPMLLLPLMALYIPISQFYLFKFSAVLTAYWGPLVTELLTLLPLVVLSVSCVATRLEAVDLSYLPKSLAEPLPGFGAYGYFKLVETLSGSYLRSTVGRTFFQTRLGLELLLAASYSVLIPSKLLIWAIPALLHTAFFNTHVLSPYATTSLQSVLKADGWLLLDRKESLTGYISVLESAEQGFRVLRCDHSLLGGEWVKVKGTRVAEPVYGVFVMLEAVRLVEAPKQWRDSEASALVIGLGIGTTPAALVAHGIDTTIVEIDPVVYEFASKYFQLPENHTAVVADAIAYTAGLVEGAQTKYDYIVHDVFTGGAEPVELFTLEFLQGLSALLKPEGVIAINYAGDLLLPPPKIIIRTIREVFPSCRIFRESGQPEADVIEKEGKDFTNMVIFCKKTSGPLTFRKATAADRLNSRTRDAFLQPQFEVLDSDLAPGSELADESGDRDDSWVLRRNETDRLVGWQEKSALGHWEVMRLVLPAHVWEQW